MEDGEWLSGITSDFKADRLLELVEEDGRPSYFREVPRQRRYLGGKPKSPDGSLKSPGGLKSPGDFKSPVGNLKSPVVDKKEQLVGLTPMALAS